MYECIKQFTVTLEGIGTLEIEVGSEWQKTCLQFEGGVTIRCKAHGITLPEQEFKQNFRKQEG